MNGQCGCSCNRIPDLSWLVGASTSHLWYGHKSQACLADVGHIPGMEPCTHWHAEPSCDENWNHCYWRYHGVFYPKVVHYHGLNSTSRFCGLFKIPWNYEMKYHRVLWEWKLHMQMSHERGTSDLGAFIVREKNHARTEKRTNNSTQIILITCFFNQV